MYPVVTADSDEAPQLLNDSCAMRDRPVSMDLFLPPSDSTLNRVGYLAERCVVVSVVGSLKEDANVAGFLASCFKDEAAHRRLWRQRRLLDGRLLITTPAGNDSLYKRTLLRRSSFRVDDWIEEGVLEFIFNL
ncbi:hypothetical protein Cni_G09870 [Canna indica]|uniref:Uncharacterized protein n=1 Tax=Canna indica TaxID=4628 RepID=A0AAQ3Q9D0_9LILI|nr:hypothetical protein Cni_G09870 [Canna indica]